MSTNNYENRNIAQTRLRGNKRSKSPVKLRKSSRSPARRSSPPTQTTSRTPTRKSPRRKPAAKSSARQSPSRSTQEEAEVEPSVVPVIYKTPSKRPALKQEAQIRIEKLTPNLEIFQNTRSKRTVLGDITSTESVTDTDKINKPNGLGPLPNNIAYSLRKRKPVEEVPPRRSSRLQEFIENVADVRQSLSKSARDSESTKKSLSKSLESYSDEEISEDEFIREKSKSVIRRLTTPIRSTVGLKSPLYWEFGGIVGTAILTFLMPLTVLAIIMLCNGTCSIKWFDLTVYKLLDTWFNLKIFGLIVGQVFIQALFAMAPIFGMKDRFERTGIQYCFNAFISTVFTVIMLFLLHFYEIINKDALLNDFLRLSTTSYILAFALSICLYLKVSKRDANKLNYYGNTGYVLYDYFIGREIHPSIKNLNVKIWISRISNINTFILLLLVFTKGFPLEGTEKLNFGNYKNILLNSNLKPTVLVYSMMQIIYILYFITREHKVTSTFFWNSEGVGYLQVVSSALYPFYFTTISKYVADSNLIIPTNILIFASVLYALGFFIMLFSSNLKHDFRSNPIYPSLANYNSIPSFHGKKILLSGLWGIVRHPNYAGDMLIHLALALPGFLTHNLVAASPALITIVVLLHRAWRDHARCKIRYGAAWQTYCNRVNSVIIPKLL